jgi:RNA polymerase sigma factor (TIGR02999 family)
LRCIVPAAHQRAMAERPTPKAEVTRLLKQWREGRHEALELLLPLVYDELRRMARIQLSRERQRHTLQATELVHEAFVRLVDQKAGWQNRLHFYGIAARCMRRILVDHARKKRAAKRPPAEGAVDLEKADVGESSGITTLLAVDQALNRIAEHSPRQAQIAELKMFGGLDTTEIAEVVGVSIATVKRDWSEAKKSFGASLGGGSRDSR